MNRFLLYIGAVMFLSLVGLAIYVFMIRQDTFEEAPPQDIVIPDGSAALFDPNAPYARVSAKETVEVGATENGDIVAVFGNGSVGVFDEQGTLKQEYTSGLSPVVKASVSPSGDQVSVLVLSTETHSSRWYRWDFISGAPAALSQDTDDVFYSPDGTLTRIVTSDESADTRFVIESGGREQTILSSRIPDIQAAWTDDSHILLTTRPSGNAEGIAYSFNTRTRGTQRLLGGKFGLSAIGSGTTLVFSETQSQGSGRMKTSVYSLDGEKNISVVTLAERCVKNGTGSFVCSTIVNQDGARIMPDDYLKGKVINRTSSLVRVDAVSGSTNTLASVPFDATRLAVSQGGNYVFAIDKNSGSLWRIRID